MFRLRRLETTGKIFFVTCNIAKGVKSLAPRERVLLLTVMREVREGLRFQLFAYAVMPNHWHALILPAPGQTISRVMHTIKRLSALRLNRARGSSRSVWQARFFDRFLRRVKDFHEAVEYIHTNPVRDHFTSEPAAWRWSSYRAFAGHKRLLLPVDHLNLPLDESWRI